jgi:4-hydroxybenzoate polyprenyltransferase
MGPLLRGLTVGAQFMRVWTLTPGAPPNQVAIYAVLVLAIWHIGRNLVGDVRDVQKDVYELPVRFGTAAASWVFRLGNVAALVLLFAGPLPGRLPAGMVVVFTWLVIELLQRRFVGESAHEWGYLGHRVMVLAAVFAHLFLAVPMGLPWVWTVAILVAAITLQPLYFWLPGKRFTPLKRLFSISHR